MSVNSDRLASLAKEIGAYLQALSEQEVPYDLAVRLAHDYHTAAIANWLGVSIVPAGNCDFTAIPADFVKAMERLVKPRDS